MDHGLARIQKSISQPFAQSLQECEPNAEPTEKKPSEDGLAGVGDWLSKPSKVALAFTDQAPRQSANDGKSDEFEW